MADYKNITKDLKFKINTYFFFIQLVHNFWAKYVILMIDLVML